MATFRDVDDDDVVDCAEDVWLLEDKEARIAAAAAGPVASAPRVSFEGVVRMALPAPPRPVEMYCEEMRGWGSTME